MAGDLEWKAAEVVAVLSWLAVPVITFFLPKILGWLAGFDASQKLQELEIHIIPELKKTMRAVEEERMSRRGDKEADIDVVAALDRMGRMLRHAREEVEDIFDDQQEIQLYRFRFLRRLRGAVETCIACCLGIARIVCKGSTRLMQWLRRTSLGRFILRRSEKPVPVTLGTSVSIDIAASAGPVLVATSAGASDESVPVNAPSDSSGRWRSCLCSSFDLLKNCFWSIQLRIVDAFKAACAYRDWSYDVVGITSCQENATAFDFVLTAIPRRNLKKRIEKVESTVSEVKKYLLLGTASKSAPNDIANKNRSRIGAANENRSKIRNGNPWKVFGREKLRDDIMKKLREIPHGDTPSSSTSPCYSVIGIYGVSGSGKTTFARYIRDYIKEECNEKLFDTVMCIHVSETFSVDDIFHEMLKDITKDQHSKISDREDLEDKLKESLSGKRFFLILDDLWVKNKNDPQLKELISPLNTGKQGSKVLVTSRRKDAARSLCADEPIEMPDLDEEKYFSMFMHYALGCTSVADEEEFRRVGRVIAEKLQRSPIAAVAVAGRLGTNPDIKFWKNTANHGMLSDTMGALWWSYQPLNPDIRRCFEFCNIFPRRTKLRKDELVHLWIAQGFVKSSCETEDMEDVAEGYIQELMSCSFLQPEVDDSSKEYFTIHDLLHDLLAKVAGSDCFRIENTWSHRGEGWKEEVPRDVRHLFIQSYDAELITKKILGLENLRTLIIGVVIGDTPVEEKVIESICKRLPKLRVLAVAFSKKHAGIRKPNKFSVPKSIAQLKHLRYLAFRTACSVTLPSALTKLHHIQLLDFYEGQMLEFPFADLVNLRHMFCWPDLKLPNLGRLISLQTIPCFFTVSNEQGYEIRQLRDLKKLRGSLLIDGLENVKSKEEALEANLAAKERLTYLKLYWSVDDDGTRCSPEVEAEVLEGLCPPVELQTLQIRGYRGSRYLPWGFKHFKQNGGPEGLRNLYLEACSQLGPAPQLEAFPYLRVLRIWSCSWDSLPGNMEHLTLLKVLDIWYCENIRSLPTLPQSIEKLLLRSCNYEFMKSCTTAGHPNWQKIEHIPRKYVG